MSADDWVLSDSGSSTSSSSSSCSRHFDEHDESLQLDGRGRKTGELHPQSRSLRDRLLRGTGFFEELFESKAPTPPEKQSSKPVGDKMSVFQRFQHLGNSVYNSVVDLLQAFDPDSACDGESEGDAFLRLFLHGERPVAPRKVESASLGMSDRTFKRRIQEAAALGHVVARLHYGSLASLLLTEIERGSIQLIAVIRTTCYDETPLPMRSCRAHQEKPRLNVDRPDVKLPSDWAQIVEENRLACFMKDRGRMKIVQTSVHLSCIFEVQDTKEMRCWNMPLPCPLAVVDRATAASLAANVLEQLTVPAVEDLCKKAPFLQDISVRDNASANMGCDELLYALGGQSLFLRVPCGAHGISNAQGYAFSAMQSAMTGIIASSLAMRPGGSTQTLRACIALVLRRSVHVHVGVQAPPPDDCRALHRKAVFDLCLRNDGAGIRRRANLELLLNGDLQSEEVHLYLASDSMEVDVQAWSEAVAEMLLPVAIPVFPRSR